MHIDTPSKNDFDTLLTAYGCFNVITRPTRITVHTEPLIDLFVTNVDSSNVISAILNYHISDHLPIVICIKSEHVSQRKSVNYFQDITPARLESFRQCIESENWSDVLSDTDPDNAYNTFLDRFKVAYASNFPYRAFKTSNRIRKPWITKKHLSKINTKNRLFQKFNKTRDQEDLKEFKIYRNQLTKELQKAKATYY